MRAIDFESGILQPTIVSAKNRENKTFFQWYRNSDTLHGNSCVVGLESKRALDKIRVLWEDKDENVHQSNTWENEKLNDTVTAYTMAGGGEGGRQLEASKKTIKKSQSKYKTNTNESLFWTHGV